MIQGKSRALVLRVFFFFDLFAEDVAVPAAFFAKIAGVLATRNSCGAACQLLEFCAEDCGDGAIGEQKAGGGAGTKGSVGRDFSGDGVDECGGENDQQEGMEEEELSEHKARVLVGSALGTLLKCNLIQGSLAPGGSGLRVHDVSSVHPSIHP